MKWLTFLLLCIPVLGLTAAYLDRLRRRASGLAALAGFFGRLSTVSPQAGSLPDRMREAAAAFPVLLAAFQRTEEGPAAQWETFSSSLGERFFLNGEEKQSLSSFSRALLCFSETDFLRAAGGCASFFAEAARGAEAERLRRSRTALSFGALGVMLLWIVV